MCGICDQKMSNMAGKPILTNVNTNINQPFFPTKDRGIVITLKPKNEHEKQVFAKQHQDYEATVKALRATHKPVFGYVTGAEEVAKLSAKAEAEEIARIKAEEEEAKKSKLTTGQKIKAFFTSGDAEKTAKGASSWLDTIGNGFGMFAKKDGSSISSSSTDGDGGDSETSYSYLYWIGGVILVLLGIWAFVHFRNK